MAGVMKEGFSRWDAAEYIESPEDATMFLEARIEEDPGDGSVVRAGLRAIARAQNITRLAEASELTRPGLYKALSTEGNPSFATILKITRALGFRFRVEPIDRVEQVAALDEVQIED